MCSDYASSQTFTVTILLEAHSENHTACFVFLIIGIFVLCSTSNLRHIFCFMFIPYILQTLTCSATFWSDEPREIEGCWLLSIQRLLAVVINKPLMMYKPPANLCSSASPLPLYRTSPAFLLHRFCPAERDSKFPGPGSAWIVTAHEIRCGRVARSVFFTHSARLNLLTSGICAAHRCFDCLSMVSSLQLRNT